MNSPILKTYGAFLCLFLPFILIPKGFFVTRINLFIYPQWFSVFKGITFFGNGLFLVFVILFLIFFFKKFKNLNKKDIYELVIASLLMFVIVTILKNVFFYEITRPIKLFSTLPVDWNPNAFDTSFHSFRSFPSGHASTIALLGFYSLQHFSSRYLRTFIFLFVLLVGFSRIFLFQHFMVDVICGLLLGFSCVLLAKGIVHILMNNKSNK